VTPFSGRGPALPSLNRRLPVPLYQQLKSLILQEIGAGRWESDQQLPTEEQFASRFRVSKITVRQALRELSALGVVRREQGRGTFVQRPALEEGPRNLTSFTGEMREHGLRATSQVLGREIVAAPPEIAARLLIRPSDPVFRLRRLRLADNVPMGWQVSCLPLALVPGIDRIDFTNASLYEVLRTQYSLQAVRARETLIAVVVSQEDAALLRVPAGAAALAAERLTYRADDQPLEYAQSIMRGDRYKVVLDLSQPPLRGPDPR